MALSYAEVAEILKIVDGSELEELVLEIGQTRLVVRKGASGAAAPVSAPAAPAAGSTPASAHAPPARPAALPHEPDRARPRPPEEGAVAVESPMVGRFYRRPLPEEPPFAEAGDSIEAGQTLALIEVMKLFTKLEAPVTGTLIGFAVEDGEAVEYDQVIAWIRPG